MANLVAVNEHGMKTCRKCGVDKPVSDFNKRERNRDGLDTRCRECGRIASAAWRVANPERASAAVAAWHAAHPESNRAASARYRARNPEKRKAIKAKWEASNPEKMKAARANWRASNPEALRIHSQNRRARSRASAGRLSKGLADRLFTLQRGKCACGCKQPLGDDYHLDHRMPLALGGTNTDDNMQLLTATCNMQKNAKHPVDFMQQRGFLI